MVPESTPEEALAKLAKSAERAAKLAMLCLAVAVLVLAIDNRLKKAIIEEGQKALRLLDEARKLAEEARDGGARTGPGAKPGTERSTADIGAGINSIDGVVHAAGASAAAGADARRGSRKVADRPPSEE